MIKVVIIEIKSSAAKEIEQHLLNLDTEVAIVGKAFCIHEGISILQKEQPNLLFLSIHLMDGLGFDILEKIPNQSFEIIFTSSKDPLIYKTFEYAKMLHITKPFSRKQINRVFNKFLENVNSVQDDKNGHPIALNEPCKMISIPTSQGYQLIDHSSIYYLEADNSYTNLHLINQSVLISSNSLKKFEQSLSSYNFCRVHDKYIVNLQYLIQYNKGRGGSITLSNGISLSVSSRKRSHFLSMINMGSTP